MAFVATGGSKHVAMQESFLLLSHGAFVAYMQVFTPKYQDYQIHIKLENQTADSMLLPQWQRCLWMLVEYSYAPFFLFLTLQYIQLFTGSLWPHHSCHWAWTEVGYDPCSLVGSSEEPHSLASCMSAGHQCPISWSTASVLEKNRKRTWLSSINRRAKRCSSSTE